MDLNDSIDRDLEMNAAEAEDVKGGRSAPIKKPRRKRLLHPGPDGAVTPRKSQQFSTNTQSTVNTVNQTVNPERP